MENLFHRRSIRKYMDKPVEKEKITAILKAAMAAPSACNQQPWRFCVVTDKTKIAQLAAVSKYSVFAKDAPVIIVPLFRSDCLVPEFAPIDLSASTENLLIEIDAQGLGGVWMGVYPRPERAKKIQQILSLSKKEIPFAMVALGYPAEEKGPEERYHEEWVKWVE
ncbi:MAG: nitroreductase family protein [Acidaminococcus sp.]|jgi:nitroreductase|nr:nitroreductase family protein [Acidaminococcus sp.]MCI2101047.1 nitroreductase family protein [Acidaminococcus sp.]MCI2117566.1 nitroreductase family protein [Acidaminococcus sp.]